MTDDQWKDLINKLPDHYHSAPRQFKLGDRVICTLNGKVGYATQIFFKDTAHEQTAVILDDGSRFRAPTSWWKVYIGDTYTNHAIGGYLND